MSWPPASAAQTAAAIASARRFYDLAERGHDTRQLQPPDVDPFRALDQVRELTRALELLRNGRLKLRLEGKVSSPALTPE